MPLIANDVVADQMQLEAAEPAQRAFFEQCIDRMLTDESLYERLSANALVQSKKYEMDAMVDSIIKLL